MGRVRDNIGQEFGGGSDKGHEGKQSVSILRKHVDVFDVLADQSTLSTWCLIILNCNLKFVEWPAIDVTFQPTSKTSMSRVFFTPVEVTR